jgi:hypothetical protein
MELIFFTTDDGWTRIRKQFEQKGTKGKTVLREFRELTRILGKGIFNHGWTRMEQGTGRNSGEIFSAFCGSFGFKGHFRAFICVFLFRVAGFVV